MSVLWIKRSVRGQTCVFEGMRVWPLCGRNIWNMNIYKENTYKKHIDKQRHPINQDRNTLDHTGTSFRSLFRKCSTKAIFRNASPALVNQGLQRISRKSRSAMFRLGVGSSNHTESPVNSGLAIFNF
ncbi:hypothetical protein K3369_22175 [Pseudomonas mandelii]|uniref:hypothetical protein n=1 Tax=Pseudomonas mandelii TaxID=75612 RepID=UPI001C834B3D|nr:hypothetical protein [Pseudomonas mandelii]QZA96429.1 hypothetical protein K3369_22175 [Pseudomonas mandelii]